MYSQLLRRFRSDSGLTQRGLADLAGVPQSSIAEIESGRREPSLSLFSRIVEAAGCEVQVQIVEPRRRGVVAAARAISERLFGEKYDGLPAAIRWDGALRAGIDLQDTLRKASPEEFRLLSDTPPPLTGERKWDAFIAAVVEQEACDRGISTPRWTDEPTRFQRPFWYLSDYEQLHDWELATAPGAFVRHGVLAAREELASI